MPKVILVTGATGNQGGAVVDALIKQNNEDFLIAALTRNAASPAAKRLQTLSKSIHVVQGNMDNPEAIFPEVQKTTGIPIWGVFMVQSVIAGGVTADQEEAQGKRFIDYCASNNVKFFVYTSVDRGGDVRSPQDPTNVSVFASKHRIEQHLFKTTGMSWFVLRPTGLIEPLIRDDMFGKIGRASWKLYDMPDRPWQWVSCKDVGYFAAQGFSEPEHWSGKCLSLAGWQGSFAEANVLSKKVTDQEFKLAFGLIARILCGIVVKDLGLSYKWCNEKGFGADIKQLRQIHPGLLSFEDCLRGQRTDEGS